MPDGFSSIFVGQYTIIDYAFAPSCGIIGIGNIKMQPYAYDLEEKDIRRERRRARELRQTQWWKRQLAKGTCYYCGTPTAPGKLTMDHLVPVARGGKTSKGNVVTACKPCNNHKKQMLPIEWAQYLAHRQQGPDGDIT